MRLLKFPSDTKLRKKYFAPEYEQEGGHGAVAGWYLIRWLVKKLTKPGDIILDPMSGAGTIMLATLIGRNVVCIELEEHFVKLQIANWVHLQQFAPTGKLMLYHGDARRFLPFPPPFGTNVNHVIFSPPYAGTLGSREPGKKLKAFAEESSWGTRAVMGYGDDRAQVGNLSYFNYLEAMEAIYKGCFDSLPPGGFLATIVRDYIEKSERVPLVMDTIKLCHRAGFAFHEIWQRDAPPSLRKIQAWQQNPHLVGELKVRTEEIVIMRRL